MRTLIVNGSPRGEKATSNLLGELLADGLRSSEVAVEQAWVLGELRDEARTEALLDAWQSADLVVLSFPLYVDSLPAPLTELLERAAERLARNRRPVRARLAVLVQCGFPEASQCDT